MSDKRNYLTRMHEVLGVDENEEFELIDYPGTTFFVNENGWVYVKWSNGRHQIAGQDYWASAINHGIIRKPRPGCCHCWNIEGHKIEYVTAVKDKDGRPMNTAADIPYRYCPSCGRKLQVGE